jgi:lysozyme family protein
MRSNYSRCLKLVLGYEGGYVHHPKDPGGATNFGVTQRVYDAYRTRKQQPPRPVRQIEPAEVRDIYQVQYWDRVCGDDLPLGLDLCTFDGGVNSGVSRGTKWLQRAVGVEADGTVGVLTLAAASEAPPMQTIDRMCDDRLAFLKRLKTYKTFGKGWRTRVASVRAHAKGMVG